MMNELSGVPVIGGRTSKHLTIIQDGLVVLVNTEKEELTHKFCSAIIELYPVPPSRMWCRYLSGTCNPEYGQKRGIGLYQDFINGPILTDLQCHYRP